KEFESVLPLGAMPPPVMRQPICCSQTWVCTHAPASQPGVQVSSGVVSGLHGVLSATLACVCTQMPWFALAGSTSQPAVLQSVGVVSVQGVLAATGTHRPVAGLHCPLLHWSCVQGFVTCVCTQLPASQPAVVQALLSLSGHGVLSATLPWVCEQMPWLASAGSISQPAVLQSLGVVSVQGVLSSRGMQSPVSGLHWPRLH